jgi:hypothetical protein
VNEQAFGGFEQGEGANRRAVWIRANLVDADDRKVQPPDRVPLARLGLLRAPAE